MMAASMVSPEECERERRGKKSERSSDCRLERVRWGDDGQKRWESFDNANGLTKDDEENGDAEKVTRHDGRAITSERAAQAWVKKTEKVEKGLYQISWAILKKVATAFPSQNGRRNPVSDPEQLGTSPVIR